MQSFIWLAVLPANLNEIILGICRSKTHVVPVVQVLNQSINGAGGEAKHGKYNNK